jgi:hypothetical protein
MDKNNWNIFFLIVVCITFLILIFWTILTGEYDLRQRVQFNSDSIYNSLTRNINR